MSSSRSARGLRVVPSTPAHGSQADSDAADPRREEVERALARFRDLLPPEALDALREEMLDFAMTHPEMKELWSRARPRPIPDSSGVVTKEEGK